MFIVASVITHCNEQAQMESIDFLIVGIFCADFGGL